MNKRNLTILTILLFGILSRFLPHPPNFTAIGAIALFGSAYFSNKSFGLIMPLGILLFSDLILGLVNPSYAFYSAQPLVYLGFFAIGLMGLLLRSNKGVAKVLGASVSASLVFFLISNFGVWITSPHYPTNFAGLISCYTAAIPFFWNTLASDLLFNGVFFGAAYWISQSFPAWLSNEKVTTTTA